MRKLCLTALVIVCLGGLGGCFASDNDSALDLGSVSIGDQLIDLQRALEAGAISQREYLELKTDLLAVLANHNSEEDAEEEIEIEIEREESDQDSDSDDDSGFLF